VWGINEEYHRKTLESESLPLDQGSVGTGLQIYYGSLHDILSFPCEVCWGVSVLSSPLLLNQLQLGW